MAFFSLGGTAISISVGGDPKGKYDEIGERARAIDGTMRETVTARKREWNFETPLLDWATANTVIGLVNVGGVLVMSGDIVNNVNTNVFAHAEGFDFVASRGGFQMKVKITVWEQ